MRPSCSQYAKISGKLTTNEAVSTISGSAIENGGRVGLAPIAPDSYIKIASGAWVSRARHAAILGNPTPAKHLAPFRKSRALAMIIISSGVQFRFSQVMRRGAPSRFYSSIRENGDD